MEVNDYIEELAEAHGIRGHTTLPEGGIVFSAYRNGSFELCTRDGQLTDTAGDITKPEWLEARGEILAQRDVDGTEMYDLVAVDPDSGAVTPILEDDYLNAGARVSPSDPHRIAFASNREQSLDLFTLDLDEQSIEKLSTAKRPALGFDWSPDGENIVYQAGMNHETGLRVIDVFGGSDRALVDLPDSEQALSYENAGRNSWSDNGIVFTSNHETGYRELAVTDIDGDVEIRFENEADKWDAGWTSSGAIYFLESQGGDRMLRVLRDGEVDTIESDGFVHSIATTDENLTYTLAAQSTVGDLKQDGDLVAREGRVDAPTYEPEEITFESFDGLEIGARHYTPAGDPIAGIVYPHGGPPAQHWNNLDLFSQSFVHAGFEVLAPDFRGSIGYGREFREANTHDLGGNDLRDVVAAADYLRDSGVQRVGLFGGSYGGYLTLMGASTTDAFDAAASHCGIVNWETTAENGFGHLSQYMVQKLGKPEENPDLYEERSPITHVDEIDIPLLVIQGENDPRVPQSEAEQLVSSLEDRNIPYEYALFEDEGHIIERDENRVELGNRLVSFFESALHSDEAYSPTR